MKTILNVTDCKKYAKDIKKYFGKSKYGTAVLYKNEDGINICDFLDVDRINYESKFFEVLFTIDGDMNSKQTIEQISYDIYSITHRSEDLEKWLKDTCDIKNSDIITFKEASELWGLDSSTLRKLITTDKVVENKDYRKSGSTWLIRKSAMERIYGKL